MRSILIILFFMLIYVSAKSQKWQPGSFTDVKGNRVTGLIRENPSGKVPIKDEGFIEFKDDAKYTFLNLPKGNHYGLIAQDVELVLPDLVKETVHESENPAEAAIKPASDGKPLSAAAIAEQKAATTSLKPKESISVKALNYIEFIPILIKGMQELSAKNDALQSQVNELKTLISKGGTGTTSLSGYLKQNIPNPANNNTVISYYLPDNAGIAQIRITDIKGSLLKVYTPSKGEGQLNIKSGELPVGTYNYSLYVNGKSIDTKQMIISK